MYGVNSIPIMLIGSIGELSIQVFVECSVEGFSRQCFQKLLKVESCRGYLLGKGWTWFWSGLGD